MSTTILVATVYHEFVGEKLLTKFVEAIHKGKPSRVHVYTDYPTAQHFTSVQILLRTMRTKRTAVISFLGVPWSGSTACKPILFYWDSGISSAPTSNEYEVCRIQRIIWD